MLEGLCDQNEHVEVQGDHGSDGVGAPPDTAQMTAVKREEGYGQNDQRENAENDPWGHLCVGKAEGGHAGENGSDEEQAVPHGEQAPTEKASQHNEPRCNADETKDDVDRGVGP